MAYSKNDLPFVLDLKILHGQDSVLCEHLLRDLHGKRKVFKGLWGGRTVVVKLFLDPRTARRHWGREKAGVIALKDASVPTPELLFAGDLNDSTPALIFDFLPEAQTSLQVWDGLTTMTQRGDFLLQLVEVVAGLHNAGLVQEDLHLENFLVSDRKIYAIDGDAVNNKGQGKALTDVVSSRNLALLFAQFPPKYDCLVERAVQRYAELRQVAAAGVMSKLSTDLPVVRRRRRHKYVEKCYRSCSEFERTRRLGQIAIARRDQQAQPLTAVLADPDAFMAKGSLVKDGASSTIVRVKGDGYDWIVKRYNIKGPWHALSRCLRPTRAWISWGNAHRLKISGLDNPRAIAVIEKRFGPFRSKGYYVCEYIDAPRAGGFFLNDSVTAAEKQQVRTAFVQMFEQFLKLGICHGDCKAANFLILNNVPWILDLDAMREYRPGTKYKKLYAVDRERFLRNWQPQSELQSWFDDRLPKGT